MNNSKYYLTPQAGGSPSPPDAYLYGTAAQTPPSNSVSPTNYHSHANVRQLRQPRQPLYIPAALRPTDPPARPTDIPGRPRAPDTPPASKDNSYDSLKADSAVGSVGSALGRKSDPENVEGLRHSLSRAASEGLEEALGEVTGLPTTAHWKPDESAAVCAVCHVQFTWYFRRHHCRHCGSVVCDNHSKLEVPLDQNARYHPDGHPSKACNPCFEEWKVVRRLRHSRASSIAESQNSSQGTAMPIPQQPRIPEEVRVGSMARSEGGMVWSTF